MKARLLTADLEEHLWEAEDLVGAALQLATKAAVPALDRLRVALRGMKPGAIRQLEQQLTKARQALREKQRAELARRARPPRQGRGADKPAGWTLRQEHVLCGKEGCEKRHGPYWYGYRTAGGRTLKHYFGKKRPAPAQLEAALGKSAARRVRAQAT